ncbi:prepilin-type N-terminal cleavage/methylation domain-containing protein [Clostridium amazonitimonense]|uniref:prepilin-type N-terminal cleavage/methylation domain-containing protein n=1 Tax=Clostridium amazonitimonense TaxID=1499689 RepID=UPI000509C6FF|nr:prepilin-type N-terminal cleavage/methylation domain-containing protein [Clostridium amazonitimonense]
MLKKKGFTLIEVLVALGLLSIAFSITYAPINLIKRSIKDTEIEYYKTSMLSLISYSSKYCKVNNQIGYIELEDKTNNINFVVGTKVINHISIPKGYELMLVGNSKIFKVQNNGTIDAGTIKFKDSNGKLHSITIQVGSFYGEIKT